MTYLLAGSTSEWIYTGEYNEILFIDDALLIIQHMIESGTDEY